jgi:hypothetical protein
MAMPFLLLGLAIPYAVLRLRETREEADPRLGLRVALSFFFSLALLLVLTGLTVFVVDLLQQSNFLGPRRFGGIGRQDFPNQAQRTAFALMVSGGLFILLHFIFLVVMTDRQSRSPVRRMFIGWRFVIHGLVVMFTMTLLMIVLFQIDRVQNVEVIQTLLGFLAVWGPSWLVHLMLLRDAHSRARRERWEPDYVRPEERTL